MLPPSFPAAYPIRQLSRSVKRWALLSRARAAARDETRHWRRSPALFLTSTRPAALLALERSGDRSVDPHCWWPGWRIPGGGSAAPGFHSPQCDGAESQRTGWLVIGASPPAIQPWRPDTGAGKSGQFLRACGVIRMPGPPVPPYQPPGPGGPPTQDVSVVPQGTFVSACSQAGTPPLHDRRRRLRRHQRRGRR